MPWAVAVPALWAEKKITISDANNYFIFLDNENFSSFFQNVSQLDSKGIMEQTCALCETELSQYPIFEGELAFCCPGCHAVFNILSTQNRLENYQETSIFQQALRSGLISNPTLLENIRKNRPLVAEHELERLHLEISDMWCPACAEIIRLILLQKKGVHNCVVDYATDLASIEFTPRYIGKEQIYDQIKALGYQPALLGSDIRTVNSNLYLRFAVAAFCALNAMMFAYPLYATYFDHDEQGYGHLFAWLSFASTLPVITYCASPIWKRFLTSLQVGIYGMETLVILGVSAAFGLSVFELIQGRTQVYFDSLTVIITFVLLGKIIESRAKFSAKNSLIRLTRALPRRGRKRYPDGSQSFVPLKEIFPGDQVVAFAGEKIVLDGEVTEGNASCDESLMTGEAIPINKTIGSTVLGGTIVQNGALTFRVTSTSDSSALHKILEMVQQDIGHKSVYSRAADHIIRWFVPLVLLTALGTGMSVLFLGIADDGKTVAATAFIRAISVLLISCPCAIGIAAPLAESHVMNALANLGAIVRNRGCLPHLGQESVFVFDKTGTITEGRFRVLNRFDDLSGIQQSILRGLSSQSTHPIAVAIANAIEAKPTIIERVEEHPGKGLRGYHDNNIFLLGSADFMLLHGIKIGDNLQKIMDCGNPLKESGIFTQVYFSENDRCISCFVLGDKIREGAKEVVSAMAPAKTVLLSGDSESAVAAVAAACGFDAWQARCSPLQKREYIEILRSQGHIVCMLGDGINDAPALTAAQIGISVVSATDISVQVSDLLLTTDRLSIIPKLRKLAKKGHVIVRQNLFWAFFYNAIGLCLASMGLLSPIFAAFAMTASSLMVLFNARRINL